MCRHFVMVTYDEALGIARSVVFDTPINLPPDWPAQWMDAYPGAAVPVITRLDQPAVEVLEWGFAVDWQKGPVFNTRIESALSGRAMWQGPISRGRCIVPVRCFFETHATQVVPSLRTGKPVKRPYRFGVHGEDVTLIAGVQEEGRFSLVTCAPNADMAPVHNRMPLVLRPSEAATWMGPGFAALANRDGVRLDVAPVDGGAPAFGVPVPSGGDASASGLAGGSSDPKDAFGQLRLF